MTSPGHRAPRPRAAMWANGGAIAGTALLTASLIADLTTDNPVLRLCLSMAASAVYLLAVAVSRGTDVQVLSARARLLVGAGVAALLTVSALWQATERTAPRVLLLLIPVALLFTTAAFALREARRQQRLAHLRDLRSRQAGEEAERRRWVRELHDDTLQELAAVHLLLATATASADPQTQASSISAAADAVDRQIQALRRLISQMRPLALDALGLSAAIEDLARHAGNGGGVSVRVSVEQLPRLPDEYEAAVYRIVQEALTNAIRHANASAVTIEAYQHGSHLLVTLRDDGVGPSGGFVPGHGLVGMRERADSIGARLWLTRAVPNGTLVELQVPVPVPARVA